MRLSLLLIKLLSLCSVFAVLPKSVPQLTPLSTLICSTSTLASGCRPQLLDRVDDRVLPLDSGTGGGDVSGTTRVWWARLRPAVTVVGLSPRLAMWKQLAGVSGSCEAFLGKSTATAGIKEATWREQTKPNSDDTHARLHARTHAGCAQACVAKSIPQRINHVKVKVDSYVAQYQSLWTGQGALHFHMSH